MAKLRNTKSNKIVIIPIVVLVFLACFLTYSFANFKTIKHFDAVGQLFYGNEYTLTYDVANCTSKTIKNGKTFGELCTPAVPDGYTFSGWTYNGNPVSFDDIVRTNQNMQLIANFISACSVPVGTATTLNYTGNYQTFTTQCTGTYKVELWGAQGGTGYDNTTYGAPGAYTSGNLYLNKNETLYIYAGQYITTYIKDNMTFNNGTGNSGGWNGGGATDVRYFSQAPTSTQLQWNNFDGLKNRIMVAAGGGTKNGSGTAGAGGGLTGYNGGGTNGGTQTTYGARQQNTSYTNSSFGVANGGCTGGNGYYPGGGATCVNGSGGGSSFISGYNGCNAISGTSTSSSIVHTGQPNHYSGKVFTDAVMIDGKGCNWSTGAATNCGTNQPQPTGANATGHNGNGVAKITYLGNFSNYEYNYNTSQQYYDFTAPVSGYYKVELWGAQGGVGYDYTTVGALGSYTAGNLYLAEGEKIYIYVGQHDKTGGLNKTNFNNGTANHDGWSGGGSTDVRFFSVTPSSTQLQWNNFDGLKSRIMVAGAGGTKLVDGIAGAGGGLTGYNGGGTNGGTQTTYGDAQQSTYLVSSFGIANGGCTGGNGYYPGGGATCINGSGGGSSFISGYVGCNAISSTSTSSSIVHTGQPNHYSGKVFINSVMIDGKGCNWSTGEPINCGANQPQPNGTMATGHSGNGYARITYVSS